MAVLSSAKNDVQFSSSFFHLKNSSFLSLSNSDAMLAAVFCVTPAPAGKVKKMRAYSRLLSQLLLQSWMWSSPAAPAELLPKCPRGVLFASVLGGHLLTQGGKLSIGTCGSC